MAEVLPLSENEVALLRSLVKCRVRFMVVGLSAAAMQGAPVVTQDVDLWFDNLNDPRLAQALRAVGAAYVPPIQLNPPMLAGPGSQPFHMVLRMDGVGSFGEEYQNAKTVRLAGLKLKVLSLERILASKVAAHRAKDMEVIPVLQDVLLVTSINTKPATRNRKKRVISHNKGLRSPKL